jgi:hypothetical protein
MGRHHGDQSRDHGGRLATGGLVVPAAHPMERRSAKRTLVTPAEFGPARHESNKTSQSLEARRAESFNNIVQPVSSECRSLTVSLYLAYRDSAIFFLASLPSS